MNSLRATDSICDLQLYAIYGFDEKYLINDSINSDDDDGGNFISRAPQGKRKQINFPFRIR